MTRRIALPMCLALAFFWTVQAQAAMKDEPKQFRGVVFGQEYTPSKDFTCEVDSEEGASCTRAGDELAQFGVPLTKLTYLFMYKRLYTVEMEVQGRENYDRLLAEFTKRHGKPVVKSGQTIYFLGKNVDIMLYYDDPRHTGAAAYVFKNLPCPVGE
ncbi:hypothetical protein JCM15519_36670 [Fundidesulfovibrio butyratiphilus]